MPRDPTSPLRAHHRLMRTLIDIVVKKDVTPWPEDLDRCSQVFRQAGGSWVRLFDGNVDDMVLLKKVLKVAGKTGVFKQDPKWKT